ncbi:MAG TPA: CocE/NonD family hydrolase C-terminal non-catalytic domain-containing protein, partial [Pseudonocardiaceae bacterium]|nr:CocE/NonD family hydrolase C-terminal non-catalytic domain-containing protein [Pseudonocardiaceae bacterium]
DPARCLPYRPWHPHDHAEPLTPGEPVPVDVEIWPTSVVVPAGYRIAVTVGGRDFELPGDGPWPAVYGVPMKGHGIFLHTDPTDRPADVFGGTTTVHPGSSVLLPFVPRTVSGRYR